MPSFEDIFQNWIIRSRICSFLDESSIASLEMTSKRVFQILDEEDKIWMKRYVAISGASEDQTLLASSFRRLTYEYRVLQNLQAFNFESPFTSFTINLGINQILAVNENVVLLFDHHALCLIPTQEFSRGSLNVVKWLTHTLIERIDLMAYDKDSSVLVTVGDSLTTWNMKTGTPIKQNTDIDELYGDIRRLQAIQGTIVVHHHGIISSFNMNTLQKTSSWADTPLDFVTLKKYPSLGVSNVGKVELWNVHEGKKLDTLLTYKASSLTQSQHLFIVGLDFSIMVFFIASSTRLDLMGEVRFLPLPDPELPLASKIHSLTVINGYLCATTREDDTAIVILRILP